MTRLKMTNTHVEVEMNAFEHVLGLRKAVRYPISAISNVERFDVARKQVRGIRFPGLGLPGGPLLGTWRTRRSRCFVAIKGYGPGYVITLKDQPDDRLVVEAPVIESISALIKDRAV